MKHTTQKLSEFGVEAMGAYADEVNLARAIPDLMDGLKPVQRRIMWAASTLGRDFVKTARVVGETIGRYHAHGDTAVSGAIEVMVQSNVPALRGRGNWGSLIDGAAAMRYTNMCLSDYGRTFFDSSYIAKAVTSFVPNYDDTTVEPVTLPAMLPNILFTAAEGIGVGTTTVLPSFTPASVVAALELILRKQDTPALLARTLKLYHKWGGSPVKDKANKAELLKLMSEPAAKIRYEAALDVCEKTKTISIEDWPPGLNPLKFIEKIRTFKDCAAAYNHKGATGFQIEAVKGLNMPQFEAFVEKVRKETLTSRSYKMNVTVRSVSIDDGVVTFQTAYKSLSVQQILKEWAQGRLLLEKKSLIYRMAQQAEAIKYTKLLIHAATNLKVVFEALKQKDSAAYMVKHLKISEAQAKQILELRVRQLSALDLSKCRATLAEQQAHLKELQGFYKNPRKKVLQDAKNALTAIESDRKFELAKQKELKVR